MPVVLGLRVWLFKRLPVSFSNVKILSPWRDELNLKHPYATPFQTACDAAEIRCLRQGEMKEGTL